MPDAALREYRAKRDFARTSEPSGKRGRTRRHAGGRYLIQKHAATRLHFDLRLEHDGVLKSWAVTRGPSLDPADKRLAVAVEDHPLDYGDFEGTIPKGQYGGGTVMLWDEGIWEPLEDPERGLMAGKLKFRLHGKRLSGGWTLVRMREDRSRKPRRGNWLLVKERDEAAKPGGKPLIERALTSVRTGRSMAEIARGDREWASGGPRRKARATSSVENSATRKATPDTPPRFVPPQLCTLVDKAPKGTEWFHEIKYDGYRGLASLADGRVVIRTRKGLDWTEKFPGIAAALAGLPCRSALIDGEIAVADDEGRTDFGALQEAIGSGGRMTYYAFDLLFLDGEDLRRRPLAERKSRLAALLRGVSRKGAIVYSDHVAGRGDGVFRRACDLHLEGIVSKRAGSPYVSGRSGSWLKVKCGMGQEFVIVGWRPSSVKAKPFSSILVGLREGDTLAYRGRVGSGFGAAEIARLWPRLKKRAVARPRFEGLPPAIGRDARFVRPDLVAEIAFRGWTPDGLVRQGSYKGLRDDKPPGEATVERPASTRATVARRAR